MNYEITYPQNWLMFFIFVLIYVAIVLGLIFAKKLKIKLKKVLVPIVGIIGLAALVYVFVNPTRIVINQDKIDVTALLHKQIDVKNIIKIEILDSLEKTEYAPTVRTFGVGLGDVSLGYFILTNGKTGFLLIDGKNPIAVIVDNECTYLLSPPTDSQIFLDRIKQLKERLQK
jgi:hypothetical protein